MKEFERKVPITAANRRVWIFSPDDELLLEFGQLLLLAAIPADAVGDRHLDEHQVVSVGQLERLA